MTGVTSVKFSASLLAGSGALLHQCKSKLGLGCSHSMECRESGSACRGVGTVWLGGKKEGDRLGECVCDNQHTLVGEVCLKDSRKVGEQCTSSRQCQKVKAVCRVTAEGNNRVCSCLKNKIEDKEGNRAPIEKAEKAYSTSS